MENSSVHGYGIRLWLATTTLEVAQAGRDPILISPPKKKRGDILRINGKMYG